MDMTTPDESKTLRVSPETHARILGLAATTRGTVGDVVAYLAQESTVRVQLSDMQRERWDLEATNRGMTVEEFVRLAVESHIICNPRTLSQIFYRVEGLCQAAGIAPSVPK